MADVEVPPRMRALPLDKVGRPVPWFVAWIDGQPDHRVVAPGKIEDALRFGCCWLCGETLGAWKAFVLGPMCAITRTTSEPPSHRDCAIFAARVCPFLTTPQMVRRDRHMPAGHVPPAGTMLRRNPGVAVVWVTRSYQRFRDQAGGLLLEVGDPSEVLWYAQGRSATRAEVMASIASGMPALRAEAEAEGPEAIAELGAYMDRALALIPPDEVLADG